MTSNLFDLAGRVAVVTGAASGLGQAMAIGLAQHGADIAAADINDVGLAQTVERVTSQGRQALAIHCDISQPDDVNRLFEIVDQVLGGVDILVNDPFTLARYKPEDLTLEDWNRVMSVNITGYFLCAQAAGRRMIARGRGGSIINMSSIGGSSALGRGNFAYSVSKGAVNQFTRELAIEWAKHKIRVNAIQPCQMLTPAVKKWLDDPKTDPDLVSHLLQGIPLNRLGEPEDVIGPVVFLASDASAMVTGSLLPVDGGNLALNAGGSHT
ncbi:MAG TPA: glucose 1-dehydrogenase [Anaerolineales bacterium]|nr:glucose 1-dehydrogenase [Anaerolineales bacterium]